MMNVEVVVELIVTNVIKFMIHLKKFNESKQLTEDDVTYSILEILDEGFTFNGDLSKTIAHFNFTSTVRFSSTPVNMLSFVRRCDTNKNELSPDQNRREDPRDRGRWILQATGIERNGDYTGFQYGNVWRKKNYEIPKEQEYLRYIGFESAIKLLRLTDYKYVTLSIHSIPSSSSYDSIFFTTTECIKFTFSNDCYTSPISED